jgi:hypothetical protein
MLFRRGCADTLGSRPSRFSVARIAFSMRSRSSASTGRSSAWFRKAISPRRPAGTARSASSRTCWGLVGRLRTRGGACAGAGAGESTLPWFAAGCG